MANIFTYYFSGRDPKKNLFCHPVFSFLYYICNSGSKIYFVNPFKSIFRSDSRIYFISASFFLFLVAIAKSILTSNLLCYLQRRYENLFCQHIFFSIYRSDQTVSYLFGLNYYAVFCLQYSNITDNSYLYYLKSSKLVVLRNRKVIHKISCSVKLYHLYIP